MQLYAAAAVLPIASPPIPAGGVLVDAGRVVAVGAARDLEAQADTVVRYDGVLMPGFVNAHAHLQYGPSFADLTSSGLAFPDWLLQVTERRMAMSDDGWRAEVASSWALAYESGTVAVADIVTSVAALDVVVPGVRYLESVALASDKWPPERQRLEPLIHAHPETGLSPHTLYTLGTDVFSGLLGMARDERRRLHPHLARSRPGPLRRSCATAAARATHPRNTWTRSAGSAPTFTSLMAPTSTPRTGPSCGNAVLPSHFVHVPTPSSARAHRR